MNPNGRTCAFCVMDESAGPLEFDRDGNCSCCRDAIQRRAHEYFPGQEGKRRLGDLVGRLKSQGRGRPYDCLVGLSGGIDSAYLAHLLRTEYDLRLLAVHVDGGWNSEAAVHNIENIVRKLNIDLYTHVVEWQEMRELQLAFLRAGVFNQDIPQDHAFFNTLYQTALKLNIGTFLSGVNFATESIIPPRMGHPYVDGRHIRSIMNRFGVGELHSYSVLTIPQYIWLTRGARRLNIEKPLNLVNYSKQGAKTLLKNLYDWNDYGTKHSESRFTKFYQGIYLPNKTGFDKRRLHLSSEIVSEHITREAALDELRTPAIEPDREKFEVRYVAKKLQISVEELYRLISEPLVPHRAYGNDLWLFEASHRIRRLVRRFSMARQPIGTGK